MKAVNFEKRFENRLPQFYERHPFDNSIKRLMANHVVFPVMWRINEVLMEALFMAVLWDKNETNRL